MKLEELFFETVWVSISQRVKGQRSTGKVNVSPHRIFVAEGREVPG
jgi:hypothetical protein